METEGSGPPKKNKRKTEKRKVKSVLRVKCPREDPVCLGTVYGTWPGVRPHGSRQLQSMKILHLYLHIHPIECSTEADTSGSVDRVSSQEFPQPQIPLHLQPLLVAEVIVFSSELGSERPARVERHGKQGEYVKGIWEVEVYRKGSSAGIRP